MKLFITRHGETTMNAGNLISGRTDVELTEKGVQQAIETGKKLKGCGIRRIICSPMRRAQHTARLIAEQIGFDPAWIETDGRLIEQDYGTFEGQIWNLDFQANKGQFAKCYPGGESQMKVAGRTYPLLDELKAAGGAPTLLVCHGGVIRVMKTYFEDMTNEEFTSYAMQNCGVLEYEL